MFFIEVPAPNQESEQLNICVLGVLILPLSTILTCISIKIQCTIFCYNIMTLSAHIRHSFKIHEGSIGILS